MKHLSSQELLSRTKSLLEDERRATVAFILHLEEISRRMVYAEWGFSSMWGFCTRELGMSEGASQRRLQAMKLLRDIPEAKSAIETGTLSLSNAAKIQSFRQSQKKQGGAVSDPKVLVEQVASMSQRECEAKLFAISPEATPKERDRVVSASSEHELRIVVSKDLYEKLQRIKGLLAHALPDASYAQLLDYMTTETLTRLEKKKGILPTSEVNESQRVAKEFTAAAAVAQQRPLPSGRRVSLPIVLKRAVFSRAQGRCEYIANDQRRCTSRFRLEIDHILPLSLNGANEMDNLRVTCRTHNVQQAKVKLGNLWALRPASKDCGRPSSPTKS